MEKNRFDEELNTLGITLSERQKEQFDRYYELLTEWNKVMNLTGITEYDEVCLKHFTDSLSIVRIKDMNEVRSMIDVGTGAGFPGIPLKIAFPQLQVTIVDSLNKRIDFLRALVAKLGLTGVELVHGRAEEFSAKQSSYREQFDLVTARAVARLSVLSELCLPAVKVGGEFLAYKAAAADDELQAAQGAIQTLGGQVSSTMQLVLPTQPEPEQRNLIIIDKVAATPQKYPRRPGLPAKKPLA